MNPQDILVDIETLGKRPGSAIIELGAVAFSPATGDVVDTFHRLIHPAPDSLADLDTLDWHRGQGTWPRVITGMGVDLGAALQDFTEWARSVGAETFWSWGATFDFPHMDAAYAAEHLPAPWRYSKCQCARTVWNVAFPGIKSARKPHNALEDATLSATDLMVALRALKG